MNSETLTQASVTATRDGAQSPVSVAEFVREVCSVWHQVVGVAALSGLLALGVTFVLPKTYTAATTLLPPQSSSSLGASALGSLGSLAGLVTGTTGLGSSSDRFIGLLQSSTIADRLIERFALQKEYGTEFRSEARKELASRSSFTVGKKDGMITIAVDARTPELAVEMAKAYVEELRRLNSTLTLTEAQQRRVFFERQLQQTRDQLSAAQAALQSAGLNSGTLKVEPKAAAESYARLKAEVTAAELKLRLVSTALTNESPEVRAQQEVLAALRAQLAKAEAESRPTAGIDYVSRYREFKYQETLFELYARQFELARADESREGTLIQVVDETTMPDKASRPKRALIVIAAMALGLFAALSHISWRLSTRIR